MVGCEGLRGLQDRVANRELVRNEQFPLAAAVQCSTVKNLSDCQSQMATEAAEYFASLPSLH